MNPEIGSKNVGDGITEFRGKNGGPILARDLGDGVVEILGKTGKRKADQNGVIAKVKEKFMEKKN